MKGLVVDENLQRLFDRNLVVCDDLFPSVVFDYLNISGIQARSYPILSFEVLPVDVLQRLFGFLSKLLVVLEELPGVLCNL